MASLVVKEFPLEEEYKKPTGITPGDIARLREWLNTQPHLPKDHITDLDLILVYHRYDRSIEVSKQQLDHQYTLRTLFASFFKDRRFDEKIELYFSTVLVTILPTRTKEGYAVLYSRMIDPDVSKFDFATSLRGIFMVLDLWQYAEGSWPGLVIIFDLIGLKLGVISKLDMQNIQQFINYFPDALLAKLKSMHFLNAPSFIDRINVLMNNFLKKELLELVAVHSGNGDCLEAVIDVDSLPIEAGGKYKTAEEYRAETLLKIRTNEEYFLEENKKRVNESLRPGKPKTIADIFGSVEGSFKQLDID